MEPKFLTNMYIHVILHLLALKVSWNSVGRITRIALQNKKAVGLTDWQTDQIHYTPANPCVVYNNSNFAIHNSYQ